MHIAHHVYTYKTLCMHRFGRLVQAIANGSGKDEIVASFKQLGIGLEHPDDNDSIEKVSVHTTM
jgi:hypothetical protein